MPLPGVKCGLHAVDQPLAFELNQHCAAADERYAQARGDASGAALVDQGQQRMLCRATQYSDSPVPRPCATAASSGARPVCGMIWNPPEVYTS